MKKKVLAVVLSFMTLITAIPAMANISQNVKVKVDNKLISFPDAQPYVNRDDRTMVPVRFVTEALGCKVEWEESRELVTITKAPYRILLRIGENSAIVNDGKSDVKKTFDTKAVLQNDRTFVPLRFVSETLGAGVAWDEVNNTVIIRSDGTVEVVATPTPTSVPTPTPTATISPADYKSPYDKFKGVELTDETAKKIYNFGYYVFGSGAFAEGGFGISFTDKPGGKEIFSVEVNPYQVSLRLNVVTPESKEMLYRTLQVLYPENYAKYYEFYCKRIDNREAGNRWEYMDGLRFHTNLLTVPYYTLSSNIRKAEN